MASAKWASAGAWAATSGVFATWACCALPATAGVLGAGVGTLGAAITPWRPYLIGLSLALAAFSLYAAYRPLPLAGSGGACAVGPRRRGVVLLAWVTAVATVVIVTLPVWQTLWF